MGVMMVVWVVVVPHVGSGPLWYNMVESPTCNQYWWANLLHIQDFYPSSLDDIVCTTLDLGISALLLWFKLNHLQALQLLCEL